MMIKSVLFSIFIFSYAILNASEKPIWVISQVSINNHYKVDLQCDHPPTLSGFQSCSLNLHDKNVIITNADIIIEGGMPEHHHGLPTSPKVIWDSQEKSYIINGLKFSMPGAWQLKFLIDKTKNLPRDIVTFNFQIK